MKPSLIHRDLHEGSSLPFLNKRLCLPFENVIFLSIPSQTVWDLSVFGYLTGFEVISEKPSHISGRFRHGLKITN